MDHSNIMIRFSPGSGLVAQRLHLLTQLPGKEGYLLLCHSPNTTQIRGPSRASPPWLLHSKKSVSPTSVFTVGFFSGETRTVHVSCVQVDNNPQRPGFTDECASLSLRNRPLTM